MANKLILKNVSNMLTEPKGIFVCCDRWKRIRISEVVGENRVKKCEDIFHPKNSFKIEMEKSRRRSRLKEHLSTFSPNTQKSSTPLLQSPLLSCSRYSHSTMSDSIQENIHLTWLSSIFNRLNIYKLVKEITSLKTLKWRS